MFYKVEAFVLALSQHYRILKEVTWDGQGSFSGMSANDAAIAEGVADMIEDIGGKGLANYCRMQFTKAWMACDIKLYNMHEMLKFIRDNAADGSFKDHLVAKFDFLVEMAYRLSNPIDRKHRTRYRRPKIQGDQQVQQLMLFPDMEADESEKRKDEAEGKAKKKKRKPRKPRKPGKPRRSRMDKLADDIIDEEYGDKSVDEYDDNQDVQDTFDFYSRGYSKLNDRDFSYFSGQSED